MDPKRFIIVVVVLLAGVGLLFMMSHKQAQPAPTGQAATQPAAATATTSSPATQATSQPGATQLQATATTANQWLQAPAAAPTTVTLGSLEPHPKDPHAGIPFQVQLTNTGAAIYTVKLANHFATDADKRLYEAHPNDYAALAAAQPDKYEGHYSLLNPVISSKRQYLPLATGDLTITVGSDTASINLENINWQVIEPPPDLAEGEQAASFSYTLWRRGDDGSNQRVATVVKTYRVARGDYSIHVSLELINHTDQPMQGQLVQFGPAGLPREDLRVDDGKAAYAYDKPADNVIVPMFKHFTELASKASTYPTGQPIPLGTTADAEPIIWMGLSNHYFGSLLYLQPQDKALIFAPTYAARFELVPVPESADSRVFLTQIALPPQTIAPGQSLKMNMALFAGPKDLAMFSEHGAAYFDLLYAHLDYRSTIDLRSGCTWAPLSFGMIWLLQKFSWIMFGNYGLAIILLVALVRLILHPLTKRSQVSMMGMQKLQPKMAALKEKYANDKEAINRETMKLYKEQGFNPLLGCLPMILQLPIWVALYSAISASVEMRHAAFLPFWITDLAAPDALIGPWKHPVQIPLLGAIHSFNLLPILLTIAMFLQMKINPQMSGGPATATTPEQAQQQKVMKYMMPFMMLFFFYNVPAGLNLYIMTSTFAGVAEQQVIREHIRKRDAAEQAAEQKITVPGKGPRSSRPKKPKGPFWMKQG